MNDLPCGTVTLVFTDIEGSTRLLAFLGSRYEEALASHRSLIREAFKSHGGVEVDTQGDALFYAFARARDAVEATVRAQQALESHAWPEGHQVRVRIGVHSGEPQVTDEGYVGEDVHVGARIASAAHGGQVLLSDATERLLPESIEGIGLRDLGQHGLKDLATKQHLYQLVIEGLTNDFPPIRTLDARPNNLPRHLGELIGRDDEVEEACSLLRRDSTGILTLTGPGGTGKTRLALQVAGELLDDFQHGVFLVDLSSVTDPSLVVSSIGGALSIRESPGRTHQEALEDHLAGKTMLLVLDNFEQVMEAAAEVASLLVSPTGLKMLITSREPLHVQGEREFPVPPLHLPTAGTREQVASAPAVILFVERAEAVKPGFEVTHDNATAVAEISRRLDGLPLAIELAAARTKLLSPDALLGRLDQSLAVLSSGRRDASKRQRTLRGTISWSYDLLSQGEQRLFRRLGVFAGGWSLDAAEEVCDRDHLTTDILDGLASLVDKSLVRVVDRVDDRFTMLETIREFALEMLEESGEAEEIRRAHVVFFRALAQLAEPHLIDRDQKQWLDRLESEHENLRAALGWTLQSTPAEGSDIASALVRFWDTRGYAGEGRQWLRRLIDRGELDTRDRMRATLAAAILAEVQDDYGNAVAYGQEALSLARQLGSAVDAARALISLGWVSYRQGDLESASSAIEEAIVLGKRADDPYLVGRSLSSLAAVRSDQEEKDAAIALYQRSVEMAERSGDTRGVMTVLVNLGDLQAFARKFQDAKKSLERALVLAEELDDAFHEAGALVNLGMVALLEGHPRDGVAALQRALDAANKIGSAYLAFGAVDGLAAALAEEDPALAARLYVASAVLRERLRVPRASGEQALYQPWIDGVKGVLTPEEEAEVGHQVKDLADVVALVRENAGLSTLRPAR